MITAKRNSEGVITITGISDFERTRISFANSLKISQDYKTAEVSETVLIIRNKYGSDLEIPIEDIQPDKTTDKFIPSEKELLQWGFENIPNRMLNNIKEYLYVKNKIAYDTGTNELSSFEFMLTYPKPIPFHTREDFMKCIGVSEAWKPSEELLIKLRFVEKTDATKKPMRNRFELNFKSGNRLTYNERKQSEFILRGYENHTDEYLLHLHSETELRMLVEILQREK